MKLKRRVYERGGRYYVRTGECRPPRRGELFVDSTDSVGFALGDYGFLDYPILRQVRVTTLPLGFSLARAV